MSIDQFLLSADTTDLNYPEIRPTLDLNFARVKALDPRITFTRASGGSYVGADGLIKYAGVNEARFDRDPKTGESLGLLIEEARTNIFQRSEEFDNAYWEKVNINLNQDSIQAPDGSFTADAIIEENNSLDKRIARNPSMTVGNRHTLSVYAKIIPNSNQRYLMLVFNNGFGLPAGANFDLITGRVGSTLRSRSFMIPLANGWYRCVMTPNGDSISGGSMRFRISSVDTISAIGDPGGNTYRGDGVSGFYLWGAQLEAGDFPTSYIPTQASTRTRAADTAVITGKNFSDFYNKGTGTIFSNFSSVGSLSDNRIVYAISDNTFNNSMYLIPAVAGAGNQTIQAIILNGSSVGSLSSLGGVYRNYSFAKTAFAFENKNSAFVIDRRDVSRNFTGGIPNVNRIYLGASWSGTGGHLNGHISRFTYFPKRLPNAQLQALTR